MTHEQVCSWLGLPPHCWPPDHYALLGLDPGENNLERIEQSVHERLLLLRSRQLNHPEQATEALNLLARAFSCLTDPEAKRAYDALLLSKPPGDAGPTPQGSISLSPIAPPSRGAVMSPTWVAPVAGTVVSWISGWVPDSPTPPGDASQPRAEPAFRFVNVQEQSPIPLAEANGALPVAIPVGLPAADAPPTPPAKTVDPLVDSARSSPARRGLGTKRALYHRIACTRRLLAAWERAGKFLGQPRRRLTRSSEAAELTRQLRAIAHYLEHFPPLLGEAGQPGFYVVSLAHQELVVPTFRMLLTSQRATLARDWRDGRKFLAAHREFLRQELHALRKASWWRRFIRAADTLLSEHPALLLLLVTLFAAGVALGIAFSR
jgi:hypothetical protein